MRHRRISLEQLRGEPWARIGEQVGQRNLSVTANTYTHVLSDETELDYGGTAVTPTVTARALTVHTPVHTLSAEDLDHQGRSSPVWAFGPTRRNAATSPVRGCGFFQAVLPLEAAAKGPIRAGAPTRRRAWSLCPSVRT